MDIYSANSSAWDEEVKRHNYWTKIVPSEKIQEAKEGKPEVWVTPQSNLPLSWLEDMVGKEVLIACGGGGQQTPIMAAFGAKVTTIDLSSSQIEQDDLALNEYGLSAKTVVGNILDMPFEDEAFDYIINPCSLNFVEDLDKAYSEFERVLKKGGSFITGIANPILYAFDDKIQEKKLKIKYTIPFADTVSLSKKELAKRLKKKDTVEFSHTLDAILGGLIKHNMVITGFFTDGSTSEPTDSFVHDSYLAIRAEKHLRSAK